VKIRYRQPDQRAQIKIEDGVGEITFEKSQRAITPGQAAVFYIGDECIGGGTIL
jgi:tRNA-uridine 2-sulfurtransferase